MVKNLLASAGDVGSVLGSARSTGKGNSNPLQYSCWENPVDRGAWQATLHGVRKSWIQLNYWKTTTILKRYLWNLDLCRELDCEESWVPKNYWTVVLVKTLESPLDCKEIQPVHPKGEHRDQSRVFIGRTDAEAETPILWPPHGKSWLIGKDPDAGRDWGQEKKGTTEDEMAGLHHLLDGHELSKLWEFVMDGEAWRAVIHGVAKSRTWLSNWTELNWVGWIHISVSLAMLNFLSSEKIHKK